MSIFIDKISQFINTYYLDPIKTDSGYNIVNTLYLGNSTGDLYFRDFQAPKKDGK